MPTFTRDWFSTNIPRWEQHLAIFRDTPCNAMELGSYEGRSAIWLLENILTHPDSRIVCVDNTPRPNLVANLAPYASKCALKIGDALQFVIDNRWRALSGEGGKLDIAYIDANHTAQDVVMEAGLIWPQIRSGGILIFDDYEDKRFTVKDGVDFFLEHWTGHEALYLKHQAMILKR